MAESKIQTRYYMPDTADQNITSNTTVNKDGYLSAYFNYNDVGRYGLELFLDNKRFAIMADVKTAAGYGMAQSLYIPKGTYISFYDTSGVYNIKFRPNVNG